MFKSSVLVSAVAMSVFASGPVFSCTPGETKKVKAAEAACSADAQSSCSRESKYTPDPGWAIRQIFPHEVTSNRGSYSVDLLAGGSHFVEQDQLQEAADSAYNLAGTYGRDSASASVLRKSTSFRNMYENVQASHNTVLLKVSARGEDHLFGGGGSIKVVVEAEIVCLLPPVSSTMS